MISKFIAWFTFLGLLFSVQAASFTQDPKEQCQGVSTVFHTVTVTAQPSQGTDKTTSPLRKLEQKPPSSSSVVDGKGKASRTQSLAATSTKPPKNAVKNNGKKAATKTQSVAATNTISAKNNGKNNGKNNDPQKSLTLDPRVIAKGFANDGQNPPVAGQVASLTSTNNFINFCLTVPNLPITNGKQIKTGSCNPAPIGMIPSVDNMPSSKFVFPANFGTIKAGETFTVEMAIKNMQTGFFVNAQANYFAAPQQLNKNGQIQGHSHVVIEKLSSLDQTKPTDPKSFAFFKGLNAAAQNGKLTATVDKGLEPGFYRLASINTASNHQPCIVPVAQHGSLDDMIYFTVTADGNPQTGKGSKGSTSAKVSSTSVGVKNRTLLKTSSPSTSITAAAAKTSDVAPSSQPDKKVDQKPDATPTSLSSSVSPYPSNVKRARRSMLNRL